MAPIYEFWCTSCGETFVVICKYKDKKYATCPNESCEGNSVVELPTAGVCIDRKKGKVNK